MLHPASSPGVRNLRLAVVLPVISIVLHLLLGYPSSPPPSQDIFASLFRATASDFDILQEAGPSGGRLRQRETGSEPCILHQSGCKGCHSDGHALVDIAAAFGI